MIEIGRCLGREGWLKGTDVSKGEKEYTEEEKDGEI